MNSHHTITSRKPVIGLLGGVGAGKSTAAQEFVSLGCVKVDGDAIGHRLLGDDDIRRQIRQRWGEEVMLPDGCVNRPALAAIVFSSPAQLQVLNGILHPRIRREMERQICSAQADPAARGVVMDAAVMLEAGWDDLCTHLVFVSAPGGQRAQRVASSRGWDQGAWQDREKSQISLDSKAGRCQYILDNSSSVSHLRQQVRELLNRIAHDADRP